MCTGDCNEPISLPIGPSGEDGQNGTNGATGAAGTNGIPIAVRVTVIPPSGTCLNGGYLVEFGPDADNDGIPDSITNTATVCNGTDGIDYTFPFKPILDVYDTLSDTSKFTTSGLGVGIYAGWAVCNGQNGTPDLRGRIRLGITNSDNTNYAYSNIYKNEVLWSNNGYADGEKEHTLIKSELPVHNHTIGNGTDGSTLSNPGDHQHNIITNYNIGNIGSGGTSATNNPNQNNVTGGAGNHTHTGNTGNGTSDGLAGNSHNNLQPYMVLIPIIRL